MTDGSIPTNLVYIYSKPETIDGVEVYPAFVTDATNEKSIKTGINWAEGSSWQENKSEAVKFECPNDPIWSVRILSLEKRGKGGRAYKVVICLEASIKLFYVDLREDTLLDVIQEVGIHKSGYLKGNFIWARVNSEMKLIRVGSNLYKEMITATKLKNIKISKSKLEIGGVYSNKHTSKVYCGNFTTLICDVTEKVISDPQIKYREIRVVEKTFKILENYQLWVDFTYYEDKITYWALSKIPKSSSPEYSILPATNLNSLIEGQEYDFRFEFSKNKLIREKDNQLKVTKSVIDSLEIASNKVLETRAKSNSDMYWDLCCGIIHVVPVKSKLTLHPEFKKYPDAVKLAEEYNKSLS